jgi:hypothetical protein
MSKHYNDWGDKFTKKWAKSPQTQASRTKGEKCK